MQTGGNGRLLLVGNPEVIHVGAHLAEAARSLGLEVTLEDVRQAYAAPAWLNKFNWWLRGRRPSRLSTFSTRLLAVCAAFRPRWLLATGIAPLTPPALERLRHLGVRTLNFLTDDPWNPAHRAPWFLEALPGYDVVFSPRRANLDDLRRLGCRVVSYLPFAYAPGIHFPAGAGPGPEGGADGADLFFAGGADRDRVPYLAACIRAGFRVRLHGGYWHRYPGTRAQAGGHLGPEELRRALGLAKVALCLVRRANRDGHVMRSFEVPAMGTCMLTEDTKEHREIFGPDGQHVVYFHSCQELVDRLRWLLGHPDERARLAAAARRLITIEGKNTYRDRLETMLSLMGEHR
jgi:spore maturation protein CgeB